MIRRGLLFLALFGVAVLCADFARSAPKATASDCRYRWVGMHNGALSGISGVRMRVEVKRLGGNPTKSAWVSLIFDSGEWLQVGYMDVGGGPFLLSQCYDNGQLGCPNTNSAQINPPPVLQTNNFYTFGFAHVGANHWRVSVNGVDIYDATFGSAAGHDPGVFTEESLHCRTATFKTLTFLPALELFDGAAWSPASGMVSVGQDWGIEGQAQNPTLGPNEVRIGSQVAPLAENSPLWVGP